MRKKHYLKGNREGCYTDENLNSAIAYNVKVLKYVNVNWQNLIVWFGK